MTVRTPTIKPTAIPIPTANAGNLLQCGFKVPGRAVWVDDVVADVDAVDFVGLLVLVGVVVEEAFDVDEVGCMTQLLFWHE